MVHTYMLKGLSQYQTRQLQLQKQIMIIKKQYFKNCALFTKCINKLINTQVDYAYDMDVVMPMYNLIRYTDTYSKTSGSL